MSPRLRSGYVVCALLLAGTLPAGALAEGEIVAWGLNGGGQCDVPAPNSDFVAVAGGWYHSLGLNPGGSIVAWGINSSGQCDVPAPNSDFVEVAGGWRHSLGLKTDGSIVAWGDSSSGQCDVPAPNSGFVAVAADYRHSLGLKTDSSIVAWGENGSGQCDVPAPNTEFVAVAAGEFHSLGLKADSSIVAWGANSFGQCDVPAPNSDYVAVAGGAFHSLGLKADGSIVAWGRNSSGQCDVPAPNSDYVAVTGGGAHSLGLKISGPIVAWGLNDYGQSDVPVPNTDFVAVAGGRYHSLGLKGVAATSTPASYMWTISGSSTDPYVNEEAPVFGNKTLYLWLVSNPGVRAAEFTLQSTGGLFAHSFTGAFPLWNSFGEFPDLLLVANCLTGPTVAGEIYVTDLGTGGEICIAATWEGQNETADCALVPQPHEWIGYSTLGSSACTSTPDLLMRASFDADAIGAAPNTALPGPPSGDFMTLYENSGTIRVRSAVGTLTGKPIELNQVPGIGGLGFNVTPPPGPVCETLTVSWRSLARQSDIFFMSLVLRGKAGASAPPILSLKYRPNGELEIGDVTLPVSWAPDIAQFFEVDVDLASDVYDLSIDGVPVAGFQNHALDTPVDEFKGFGANGGGTYAQDFAFDDIRVVKTGCGMTVWDGGGDGISWSDAANWDTDLVPGPADDVRIDLGVGARVVVGSASAAKTLTLAKIGATADSLEIVGAGQLDVTGSVSNSDGVIEIVGALTAGDDIDNLAAGKIVVQGPGSITFVNSLDNQGSFEIHGSGSVQAPVPTDMGRGIAVGNGITNLGSIVKTGTGTSIISALLDNQVDAGQALVGDVQVLQGTLDVREAFTSAGNLVVAPNATLSTTELDLLGGSTGQVSGIAIGNGLTNGGVVTLLADGALSFATVDNHGTLTINSSGCLICGFETGNGIVDNFGIIRKLGPETVSGSARIRNLIGSSSAGLIEIVSGGLSIPALENSGSVDVQANGTLSVAELDNFVPGFVDVGGTLTGTTIHNESTVYLLLDGSLAFATVENLGTLWLDSNGCLACGIAIGNGIVENLGWIRKIGPETLNVSSAITNDRNVALAKEGTLEVLDGGLNVGVVDNFGTIFIETGGQLTVTTSLDSRENAVLSGTGTLDVTGASFVNQGILETGASIGTLTFLGPYNSTSTAQIQLKVNGPAPAQYDQMDFSTFPTLVGSLGLALGFQPTAGQTFSVFGWAGGAPRLGSTFDCFSGLEAGSILLDPVVQPDGLVLFAVDSTAANNAPAGAPDSATTDWLTPVVLPVLANDSDPDGHPLTIVSVSSVGDSSAVFVDAGDTTLTYVAVVAFDGPDTFQYLVTDCHGGLDSATVVVEVTATAVESVQRRPEEFRLHAGFPNPFRDATSILFDLPKQGRVSVLIHDVTGRVVRELVRGARLPGRFVETWDGRSDAGLRVSAGVYFVSLRADDFRETRKIVRLQ